MDVATRRTAEELARRRVELVGDLDQQRGRRAVEGRAYVAVEREVLLDGHLRLGNGRARLRYRRAEAREGEADRGGVEEIGGRLEAVAEATHALERQARGLGLAQELRHPRARQPHLRGEVLAGVEVAVRKLAQERETERSKH